MKKFKILIASDVYYPRVGGVSEHIYNLTKGLMEKGHSVTILTSGYNKDDYPDYKDPDYVKRVGWGISFPANKSISTVAFSPRISKRVKEILEKGNFDIVHTHGPLAPVLPLLVLKHSSSLNFATFHAAYEESKGYKLFSPYLISLFKKINGLIAVSPVARASMEKYFPGDYKIIPNGVDIERFSPEVPPIDEFLDGKKNILFVGRIEPRKGLKYLLKSYKKLRKIYPNARLIVVGKGPLKKYYKLTTATFNKDVVFVGEVPHPLLPRYYATSDIFCSPATGSESFGIVLLEAMASGKPVLASRIPGYQYVIKENEDGFLFEPENPDDLTKKLLLLLRREDLCKELGEKGRRKTEEKFSWKTVVNCVENFYYEVYERTHK